MSFILISANWVMGVSKGICRMRVVQLKDRVSLPAAFDFYQIQNVFVLDKNNARMIGSGRFLCSASTYVERAILRLVYIV